MDVVRRPPTVARIHKYLRRC